MTYQFPDPMAWDRLVGPLSIAEDAVAKLDERLRQSPIRDGFVTRSHFDDACASIWLAGELVHIEDLVLHDAARNIRAPTHDLTRAHAVLRARRLIANADPTWALTAAGLAILRGQGRGLDTPDNNDAMRLDGADEQTAPDSEFAAIDAVLARSSRTLAAAAERDPLIFDPDWDEDARLTDWQQILADANKYPPLLAAALAWDAWETLAPLQHRSWLGPLLVAALLRARAKTRAHLACLNIGLRTIARERRRALDQTTRLIGFLDAATAAATAGLKEHDRLMLARTQLMHRLGDRRKTSHLPALIDLVLARPLVSTNLVADELEISARAAQNLVTELGLRELTGRGRYRAWGI
jgi:Protein of unknown function (DUF1612)/HTH DNA binding domain